MDECLHFFSLHFTTNQLALFEASSLGRSLGDAPALCCSYTDATRVAADRVVYAVAAAALRNVLAVGDGEPPVVGVAAATVGAGDGRGAAVPQD